MLSGIFASKESLFYQSDNKFYALLGLVRVYYFKENYENLLSYFSDLVDVARELGEDFNSILTQLPFYQCCLALIKIKQFMVLDAEEKISKSLEAQARLLVEVELILKAEKTKNVPEVHKIPFLKLINFLEKQIKLLQKIEFFIVQDELERIKKDINKILIKQQEKPDRCAVSAGFLVFRGFEIRHANKIKAMKQLLLQKIPMIKEDKQNEDKAIINDLLAQADAISGMLGQVKIHVGFSFLPQMSKGNLLESKLEEFPLVEQVAGFNKKLGNLGPDYYEEIATYEQTRQYLL